MGGTIFGKIKIKPCLIALRIITFLMFLLYIFKRVTINYAYIYSFNGKSMEYSLKYSVLALVFLLIFILSFIKVFHKNAKSFIVFLFSSILVLVLTSIVASNVPKVNEYESNKNNNSVYFLFDNYIDKGNIKNYYYYKEIKLGNAFWVGCNLYKEYEADNSFDDLIEDTSDKSILISFYYLNDSSGKRIQEYVKKQAFNSLLNIEPDYINEIQNEQYSVYESDFGYEFVRIKDDEVFYLSAEKNNKIHYDINDFISVSKEILTETQENGSSVQ